jgi:hypothetical protein
MADGGSDGITGHCRNKMNGIARSDRKAESRITGGTRL